VAYHACKAMQRKTPAGELFHLRDALRIAHPTVTGNARLRVLLGWLTGKTSDKLAAETLPPVDAFLTAKSVTTPKDAIRVITERQVPWEFLPDTVLADPGVWDALIDTIGMTALVRNLARMTRIGTLKPMGQANRRVAARLTNAEALRNARIHPMDLFLAMRVYRSGRSQPNPQAEVQTWTPVPTIYDALEDAYELSFGHIEPTGKRLLIAVDSSGSMTNWQVTVGGSPLGTVYEVACAMAVMLTRIEHASSHVIDVGTRVHASRVTPRTNLREIASWRPSGGGTDLSLPFTWARHQNLAVDGAVVLTDNETWAGSQHPSQALDSYRRAVNPSARAIVASMTATGHSIGDPKDLGVLNIAGLDASLPTLVTGYIR